MRGNPPFPRRRLWTIFRCGCFYSILSAYGLCILSTQNRKRVLKALFSFPRLKSMNRFHYYYTLFLTKVELIKYFV